MTPTIDVKVTLTLFPALFENALLGSMKSFLQLIHPFDISLYLAEVTTLCHSEKSPGLTPLFSSISLLASRTLKGRSHGAPSPKSGV